MLALKLALRNIKAHGQRNLILFLVTSAVCLFLFVFLTFSDGQIENTKNGIDSFYSPPSDIMVFRQGVYKKNGNWGDRDDWMMKNIQKILTTLEGYPKLTQAVAGYPILGMNIFHNKKKYLYFNFVAQDALRDNYQKTRYTLVAGEDLSPKDRFQVLLHRTALENSPMRVGDEILITGNDAWGQVVTQKAHIKGFFSPVIDNPNIYQGAYTDLTTFGSLSGYTQEEAGSVRLSFERGTDLVSTAGELNRVYGNRLKAEFFVTSSIESESGNVQIYQTIRLILVAMALLMILITAFGIMNVVSVNLYDRKKEIGTYFCLGTEKPFLLAVYSWEIFLVNLGGSLAGLLAGLGVRELVNSLKFTSQDPGFQVVMGGSVFTLGLSPSTIIYILGGVMVVTLVTSLLILRKALNVSPVVAVREIDE